VSLALLHSPAEVLQQLLQDIGAADDPEGDDPSWPVYSTSRPDAPDQLIAVVDTAAQDDGKLMSGEYTQHWGVQLCVRSNGHNAGLVKAESVRRQLNEDVYQAVVNLDDATYFVPAVLARPTLVLDTDSPNSKRCLFTINCLFVVDRRT